MSRAKDIFERLRSHGLAALDDLIADREPESLFLDFKRSADDGVSRTLHVDDSKNLCKAISGFANSSGGVIVFGVDCRRDPSSGNEEAFKMPLANADGFNTKLQGAVSRSSIPPHPGVEVIAIPGSDATSRQGYVAMLVPQSTFGPVRSVKSDQYHLRTGSDFSAVPHDLLAGMFGRAPQPHVGLNLIAYPARLDSQPGHLTIAFCLVAVNFGVVLAERPYVSVHFGDFPKAKFHASVKDQANFSLRESDLPVVSVIAVPALVLAPGAAEPLCEVILSVPVGQPRGIELRCTIGSAGALPRRFRLEASQEKVEAGIERGRGGSFPSTDILTLVADA